MWTNLSPEERELFKKLSTPEKIQNFLDTLPQNYEKDRETCRSPRTALREKKAHCIEGAFIAAVALWIHGERPLLLDFKTLSIDEDHVVALYKKNGYWGAISKTNHPILRYRDPIYKTVRELALSYFHEYFMFQDGRKTLRSYSRPYSLKRFGTEWITSEEDLWHIAQDLDESPHAKIVPKGHERYIRRASNLEQRALDSVEWLKTDPRT